MTKDEALKLALAVLKEWHKGFPDDWTDFDSEAIIAIKEALSQPEQEPVGFAVMERPWVGLTDEEINDAYRCAAEAINFCTPSHTLIVRAAEAKLKEKNT